MGNAVQAAPGVVEDAIRLGWRPPALTDRLNSKGVSSKGNSLCAFLGQKLGATIQELMKGQLRGKKGEEKMAA